jgi:hypothetical protein
MQQPARGLDRHAHERDHDTDKHEQLAHEHDQPATRPMITLAPGFASPAISRQSAGRAW